MVAGVWEKAVRAGTWPAPPGPPPARGDAYAPLLRTFDHGGTCPLCSPQRAFALPSPPTRPALELAEACLLFTASQDGPGDFSGALQVWGRLRLYDGKTSSKQSHPALIVSSGLTFRLLIWKGCKVHCLVHPWTFSQVIRPRSKPVPSPSSLSLPGLPTPARAHPVTCYCTTDSSIPLTNPEHLVYGTVQPSALGCRAKGGPALLTDEALPSPAADHTKVCSPLLCSSNQSPIQLTSPLAAKISPQPQCVCRWPLGTRVLSLSVESRQS